MSTGSWIEQQILRAQRDGAFEDLPGTGKPIPDLLAPETDLDYAAKLARREGIEPTLFLPPALALAKEAEDLPARLAARWSEARVREAVEDLNARIKAERLKPQNGPPVRTRLVDVEQAVAAWRAARPEPAPVQEPPPTRRRWRR
jgi:hypothetical protein